MLQVLPLVSTRFLGRPSAKPRNDSSALESWDGEFPKRTPSAEVVLPLPPPSIKLVPFTPKNVLICCWRGRLTVIIETADPNMAALPKDGMDTPISYEPAQINQFSESGLNEW